MTTLKASTNMSDHPIIDSVKKLFSGVDEQDWEKVESVMANRVMLDYTSMNGGTPVELTARQISENWASFLPGFDKTHHQLTEFSVEQKDNTANVHYFGKAEHWIGQEIWIVEATYDTTLIHLEDQWLINKQKLNFIQQSGNTSLPQLAGERMKK